MLPSEVGDGVVIGVLIGGEKSEKSAVVGGLLDAA